MSEKGRESKTIAILQSSYIPWKGYFDLIAAVDEFVIFDDVQFTRRDWRNRNRVIVNGKPHWLTIPVATKGNYSAPINEIRVADPAWTIKHWAILNHAYRNTAHFADFSGEIEAAYETVASVPLLSGVNVKLLRTICDFLDITTPFTQSDAVARNASTPTGRLVEICVARGATSYVSGPSARNYIVREDFEAAGVSLFYANYSHYPVYNQGTDTFEPAVSMLDVIFRLGKAAREHLKLHRCRESFLDPA